MVLNQDGIDQEDSFPVCFGMLSFVRNPTDHVAVAFPEYRFPSPTGSTIESSVRNRNEVAFSRLHAYALVAGKWTKIRHDLLA